LTDRGKDDSESLGNSDRFVADINRYAAKYRGRKHSAVILADRYSNSFINLADFRHRFYNRLFYIIFAAEKA
jgi:hypothetical protein